MSSPKAIFSVLLVLAVFLVPAGPPPVFAGPIGYSVQYMPASGQPPVGDHHLYAIDLATGVATDKGYVDGPSGGLAFAGNNLYSIGGSPQEFWNLTIPPGFKVGDSPRLPGRAGLDFNPVDNKMYNINGYVDWSRPFSEWYSVLYTIDLATGAATQIGGQTFGIAVEGLAINRSGAAYAAQAVGPPDSTPALYRVDLGTGALSLVGSFSTITHGASGLAFDDSGTLWLLASDRTHDYSEIYTMNLDTGAATWIANVHLADGTHQGYFPGLAINPVPVPGTLLLLGSGLLALAGWGRKKAAK